ncbi:MAG: NYN domain-containing protein [Gemmatimonadetes bacterium]|nr:NYN domain-containing protein [Gemmatimonadota bacterium]
MYPHLAHVFVDGASLRKRAQEFDRELVNPRKLADALVQRLQDWAAIPSSGANTVLGRVTYYDAKPDDGTTTAPELAEYWSAVELLPDTQLGFGALRGLNRKTPRQKGVDTLIAVDMLVGAFSGLFDVAVLVASDADFVPVVEEVKRRGVMVAVASLSTGLSDDLRRIADRFIEIGPAVDPAPRFFPKLDVSGKTFRLPRTA